MQASVVGAVGASGCLADELEVDVFGCVVPQVIHRNQLFERDHLESMLLGVGRLEHRQHKKARLKRAVNESESRFQTRFQLASRV